MSEPVEIKPGDSVCLKGHLTAMIVGRISKLDDAPDCAQVFTHTDTGAICVTWIPLVCLELADLEEAEEDDLDTERLDHLLRSERDLAALLAAGVDNWEGYDAAMATVIDDGGE